MTRKEKLAWAAGIVDGEGCIRLVRRKTPHCDEQYVLLLKVNNTEIRMLERMKELFGGQIYTKAPCSTTKHQQWDWQIWALCAEKALRELLPFLLVKKEQAETALLARTYMKKRRGKYNIENLKRQRELCETLKKQKRVNLILVKTG